MSRSVKNNKSELVYKPVVKPVVKNKGGRPKGSGPVKFKTVEELQQKIDAYFKQCDKEKQPYTITGLALALDTTKKTLSDYEAKNGFGSAIKKAKSRCEEYAIKRLFGSQQVAGAIFYLKNAFGYQDSHEIKGKHSLKLEIVDSFDKNGQPEKVSRKEIRAK